MVLRQLLQQQLSWIPTYSTYKKVNSKWSFKISKNSFYSLNKEK